MESEVVGAADVEEEGVEECFGWVAVGVVVGDLSQWYWFGWKEGNAGGEGCRPYSLQRFCDTNLRTGPTRSCTNAQETGRSDKSEEEEVAREGQIVVRHCAMHRFDEPGKRDKRLVGKQTVSPQDVICAGKPRKRSEIAASEGKPTSLLAGGKGWPIKWDNETRTFIPPPV